MSPTCPPRQQQLPPALQLHILSLLAPNDRALSGRLVSPDAADALSAPQHCTASLSQPLPPHAAPWAVEAGQQHVRQLPFLHKLQLLCVAAASGSEANLEVALALLQPSIFSEVWYAAGSTSLACFPYSDPGVVAVQAGHPQLLGWLLERCPGLLNPDDVLTATAKHCDLAGLQAAWELLRRYPVSTKRIRRWRPAAVTLNALAAAARSTTPDAVAKMEWLMSEGGSGCRPDHYTAAAAVRSGDLGRLRWLRARGCPVDRRKLLQSALWLADLAVAERLVDEAGCALPADASDLDWHCLRKAAVRANDAMAKLQWLVERGAPPLHEAGNDALVELVPAAVGAGRVDVLQHLRSLPGLAPEQDQEILQAAFDSSGMVSSIPMAEYLLRAGMRITAVAFPRAAGNLDLVRWLACNVSSKPRNYSLGSLVTAWPKSTAAHSWDLLQAVQLLVEGPGCRGWCTHLAATGYVEPSDANLCAAAERGEVAVVQYLLQQLPGYRPSGQLLAAAARGGCEALLEWLVEKHPSCLTCFWMGSAYIAPAGRGDLGTLTALRRVGVPWGAEDVVVRAMEERCPEPALQWLVGQGAPVGGEPWLESAVTCKVQQGNYSAVAAAWLWSVAEATTTPAAAAVVGKL